MAVLYFGNVENQSWRKPSGNAFDIPDRPDRAPAYLHQRAVRRVCTFCSRRDNCPNSILLRTV
jgi:hypothetical protein